MLVLALMLLVDEVTGGVEEGGVARWARSVASAATSYVPYEPWVSPDSWRREDQHIPKQLNAAIRARSNATVYTLGQSFFDLAVDYGGGVAFIIDKSMLEKYFEKVSSGALRGLGHDARAGRGAVTNRP